MMIPSRPTSPIRAGITPAIGPLQNELAYADREAYLNTGLDDFNKKNEPSLKPQLRLPSSESLDYVNKLATASLLVVAFLVLTGRAIVNPSRALSQLVRGAERRVGVR